MSITDKPDGKLQGVYLADGIDKILYTNGKGIGVRSDYNGVLLLDTILQTPVSRSEDTIKLELLLSEACLLHQCLRLVDLPGVDHVQSVLQELWNKILVAQETQKKGIKAQKVIYLIILHKSTFKKFHISYKSSLFVHGFFYKISNINSIYFEIYLKFLMS